MTHFKNFIFNLKVLKTKKLSDTLRFEFVWHMTPTRISLMLYRSQNYQALGKVHYLSTGGPGRNLLSKKKDAKRKKIPYFGLENPFRPPKARFGELQNFFKKQQIFAA